MGCLLHPRRGCSKPLLFSSRLSTLLSSFGKMKASRHSLLPTPSLGTSETREMTGSPASFLRTDSDPRREPVETTEGVWTIWVRKIQRSRVGKLTCCQSQAGNRDVWDGKGVRQVMLNSWDCKNNRCLVSLPLKHCGRPMKPLQQIHRLHLAPHSTSLQLVLLTLFKETEENPASQMRYTATPVAFRS